MIDPNLHGKTVLITGANHGIGAATARALALQGANVFITFYRQATTYSSEELRRAQEDAIPGDALYRANQQRDIDQLLARIQSAGGVATAYEADLFDSSQIPDLFTRCEEAFGPVDILINNHTYCVLETFDPAQIGSGVQLISPPEVDNHHALNVRATVMLMLEYFRRYLARNATEGRVINISTDAAHAHPANVSYAASKHAIESYSRSAAAEMGRYGITINVVAPGPIQTGYITPDAEAEIAPGTPLGRLGEPEDVADVVVFFASEQARWLTGQLIYVGGGWRMPH